MKPLMKTALAVALAAACGQTWALGLGQIQVKSGLNQPLVAEIPVTADAQTDIADLRAAFASDADFQRVGLSRARIGVPIDFSVGTNGRGQTVIKLTTKEVVREPFLDFLVEVNWPKGKLLREYTILLDPPVTAPAVATTTVPSATVAAPAAPPIAPPAPPREATVPVETRSSIAAAPSPPPPRRITESERSTPPHNSDYGPVERGQTLSSIARELEEGEGASHNQMLLALLRANPNAFYRDNINALKAGAVLRIPSGEQLAAAGSVRQAAVAVRAQNQDWRENVRPVLTAHTGAAASADTDAVAREPSTAAKSEHLALVPPQAGKGNESGVDHAGSGSGGGRDSAQTHAELARTKEALANRDQESTELKSRVKELEGINDKGAHLLSLKDSQIAELQDKLKQLQAQQSAIAAKPIVATPIAATVPAVPPVATAVSVPAPTASPSATSPVAPPASSTVATTGTAANTLRSAATPVSPPVTSPPVPAPAAPKPAVAIKPAPTLVANKPWYADYFNNPLALYGVGGVFLLVAAWALMRFVRKPKIAVPPQLDESADDADAAVDSEAHADADEHALLERLTENPHDEDASLELLRHYYAEGDAPRFEALAESSRGDFEEDSPEWQEILEMGENLSPHHPLFAPLSAHESTQIASQVQSQSDHVPTEYEFERVNAPAVGDTAQEPYDFSEFDESVEAPTSPAHRHEPIEHARIDQEETAPYVDSASVKTTHAFDEPVAASEEIPLHEEFFVDEGAIATRLDLARAYLDMGDHEGARLMLDEVLIEGSVAQKDQARALLADMPH